MRKTKPMASFDAAGTCIPALFNKSDTPFSVDDGMGSSFEAEAGAMNANYSETSWF